MSVGRNSQSCALSLCLGDGKGAAEIEEEGGNRAQVPSMLPCGVLQGVGSFLRGKLGNGDCDSSLCCR